MLFKKTVAIDFDGVIHVYTTPWTKAEEIHDGPTNGAFEFIHDVLEADYAIVIFSARAKDEKGKEAIKAWLKKHCPSYMSKWKRFKSIEITSEKPHAEVYIDDRGWNFSGKFPTVSEIKKFKPWNKNRK